MGGKKIRDFCRFKGVEGTSVTLVSSRSSRAGTRIEGDEEEEVKMASTADVVGHRNEPHVHLWSQGRDEEEEDYDERREREELMALLRPVQVSISGHHAPSPLVRPRPEQKPTVDESKRTKTTGSRDHQTSTPVNTTTDFQWTIEWTPSVDVFRHHSSTSSSVARFFFLDYFIFIDLNISLKVDKQLFFFRGQIKKKIVMFLNVID